MSVIKDMFFGSDDAADAAIEASQVSVDYQREALDYLKQTERLPQAYREQALAQLGALYGLPGPSAAAATTSRQGIATTPVQGFQQPQAASMNPADYGFNTADAADLRAWDDFVRSGGPQSQDINMVPSAEGTYIAGGYPAVRGGTPDNIGMEGFGYAPLGRQDFVAGLREDPFYLDLLGAGEEAVLRGASATGGLRSGTASENLARNNQNILRGLYSERVGGLQGLSGLPSYAPQIAQGTAGIGQTLAQGITGSAQAIETGKQQQQENIMAAGQIGLAMFSDRRLKNDIVEVGKQGAYKLYTWTWNKLAEGLGLKGSGYGVMADEVEKITPESVSIRDGYKIVDYQALGVM